MAGFQPLRRPIGVFSDDDDIDNWMAQRNAELASRDDAETAGRDAWDQATRSGRELNAPRPGDVARLGAEAMSGGVADVSGVDAGSDGSTTAPSDADPPIERAQPVTPGGPLLTPPRFSFDNARTGEASERATAWAQRRATAFRAQSPANLPAGAPRPISARVESEAARNAARWAGYRAGLVPGVLRGGLHAIQGLSDALIFGARIANPAADRLLSAPGQSAPEQLGSLGGHLGLGVVHAVRDPPGAMRSARALAHKINLEVNPWGAPLPATTLEARRAGEHVGANDGEIVFNLASTPVGGETGATFEGLRYASEAGDVGKYLRAGHPLDVAIHLAKPYVQPGHHAWARSRMLPDFLGGGPLPSWLSDSRLNMLRPRGIDIGQFYDLHARVDPQFYGAKLPGRGPGQGWSAKRLGIQKYDREGQFWHGIPGYTKGLVSGAMLDFGDDLHSLLGGSQSQ